MISCQTPSNVRTCALCIPIIGPTLVEIKKQLEQAALLADRVELRLDYWEHIDENFISQLRLGYPHLPMIFTLRKSSQGGKFRESEESRMRLLESLLRLQPEYVDIEADAPLPIIQSLQQQSPATKWILSWHDLYSTPSDLEQIFQKLSQIRADLYKIVTTAQSTLDSLRMLLFAKRVNVTHPILCALCMGKEGECTRILSPLVGNPLVFASLKDELASAPGQLDVHTLLNTYHFNHLNRHTQLFGLIGNPVDKSFSHLTHNCAMMANGLNAVYVKFNVLQEELTSVLKILPFLNCKGLSITMPYKELVMNHLSTVDADVSMIGACNTLSYSNQGWVGSNTDGVGALKALGHHSLKHFKVVIIGCGGTARSIAYQAKKEGAEVVLLNRTASKAQAYARHLGIRSGSIDDLNKIVHEGYDILIQTTPIGMAPNVDEIPISSDYLLLSATVLDAISNPIYTRLLIEASRKGCQIVSGIDMFIYQAIEQFNTWFENSIDQKQMEKIMRQSLSLPTKNSAVVCESFLNGTIYAPPSKSHSIRAILLGAMVNGVSVIDNYLDSPDIDYAIQASRQLGAQVEEKNGKLVIQGVSGSPHASDDIIDSGNSGQVLRFVAAFAALSENYTVLTGDLSIRTNRLVQPLLDGLEGLGAFAKSTRENGCAPIIIKGPIQPGNTKLLGRDSQPVSALLMAAAFMNGNTTIKVENPGEKPWINLTLSWLDRLGVSYTNHQFEHFTIQGCSVRPSFNFSVPGDFSSIAFPLVAALITKSEITIQNVDMDDVQGDKALILLLQKMGGIIEIDAQRRSLHIKKGCTLKGQVIDVNPFIDAITILAVVGCFAEGQTTIVNGAIARNKECDRINCISRELKKMGAQIEPTEDGLIIHQSNLRGATVESYQDHRMALSLMVAALAADGETIIKDVDCILKSYPDFIKAMQGLGANINGF